MPFSPVLFCAVNYLIKIKKNSNNIYSQEGNFNYFSINIHNSRYICMLCFIFNFKLPKKSNLSLQIFKKKKFMLQYHRKKW